MSDERTYPTGGEFLVAETDPNTVFTPEDFDENQRMIGQVVEDFCEKFITPLQEELESRSIEYQRHCSSISIYGPHFSERPAIAGTVFETISKAGVELLSIATSFSTVTFLTHADQADMAVSRLSEHFLVP